MKKRKRKRPALDLPDVQQALVVLNQRYLESPFAWISDAIQVATLGSAGDAPCDFPCEIHAEEGTGAKYTYLFFRTRWREHRGISMLICEDDSEGITTIFQAINESVDTLTGDHCPISTERWKTIGEIDWRVFARFVSHLAEGAFTAAAVKLNGTQTQVMHAGDMAWLSPKSRAFLLRKAKGMNMADQAAMVTDFQEKLHAQVEKLQGEKTCKSSGKKWN